MSAPSAAGTTPSRAAAPREDTAENAARRRSIRRLASLRVSRAESCSARDHQVMMKPFVTLNVSGGQNVDAALR